LLYKLKGYADWKSYRMNKINPSFRVLLGVILLDFMGCADTIEVSEGPQIVEKKEVAIKIPAKESIPIIYLDAVTLTNKLRSGELSASEVTAAYLERIQKIDVNGPKLNSIIDLNPDAQKIALKLDEEFMKTGSVGLLHGIPVLLKANIDTNDHMATSAGSIALENNFANTDAPLVANLRSAGAIILGKTNLSEWANFRSTNSSSGWSSLGGLTKNPYVLDRNACGSSSGSSAAVAAHLAPLAVGTETDGSIVCPASVNGVVGIKPTVGRISGLGIIPISVTQDTAGSMATTVAGAELLYQIMHGLEFEPPLKDYKLNDIRVGVGRNYFGAKGNPEVTKAFEASIRIFENAGSVIVDNIELTGMQEISAAEFEVLLYEFKDGLNNYLKNSSQDASFFTLENLMQFNTNNAENVMPHFGQEIFEMAQAKADLNSPEYRNALQDSHVAMQVQLQKLFAANKIDVLIMPTNQPAWKTTLGDGDEFKLSSSAAAAISGYPNITVPMGNVNGLPIGLSFIGLENDDEKLIEIAKQFEAIAQARITPKFIESLE